MERLVSRGLLALISILFVGAALGCSDPASSSVDPPTASARGAHVAPLSAEEPPAASGELEELEAERPVQHLEPRFEVVAGPNKRDGIALPAPPKLKKGAPQPLEPVRDVLDVLQVSPTHLVAVLRPGDVFIESHDAGRSWSSWRIEELEIVQLAMDSPTTWYGLSDVDPDGSAHRVARTKDGGRTWELRLTGRKMDPDHPSKLVDHRGELILAVGRHLLRSKDGKKWVWDNVGLPELTEVTALSLAERSKSARLLVGSSRGHIAARDGSGEWALEVLPVAEGERVPEVRAVAESASGERVAATSHGLFVRAAGGDGWQRVEALGRRSYRGVVFAGKGGQGLAFGDGGEVAGTIDGGKTWVRYTGEVLGALGLERRSGEAALDALAVTWTAARAVPDGFVLLGDELTVVRVATPAH